MDFRKHPPDHPGFRLRVKDFRASDLWFEVEGSGFRVLGFRVYLWFRVRLRRRTAYLAIRLGAADKP